MVDTMELIYVARLVLAAACGILIGYERKNRSKEAGVRTHCVVACASALMMILSKYAYSDVVGEYVKLDPSRVAAGVVSGIGFLGAGMIFVHKKTVTGLTTAAGVWATSGIGMAIGAGMYVTGISAALIILLIQVILHLIPRGPHSDRALTEQQKAKELEELLVQTFEEKGIPVVNSKTRAKEAENASVYKITVTVPKEEDDE